MIYRIKEIKNKLIENAYLEGMKELNEFFGINWIYNTPNICVLKNRSEIDLFQYKSERWVVGFTEGFNTVNVLERNSFEKESSHKKPSSEEYPRLIKHELCHLFYNIKAGGNRHAPRWLTEGVAICLSGQLNDKKPVGKFKYFIDSYSDNNKGTYLESGKAVELLIKNFKKEKLLKLISRIKECKNKVGFADLFKEIYGFDLNYNNFNNLLIK